MECVIKVSKDANETNAKNCVIIGLSNRNGISLTNPLDIRGMNNLLIVDLKYFIKHRTDVVLAVKSQLGI